jgi:hypothetical protein
MRYHMMFSQRLANSRECRAYFCEPDIAYRDGTGWLGRQDSNLCIRNRARLGLRLFLQDFRLGLEMPANAGRLRRAVSCLYLE